MIETSESWFRKKKKNLWIQNFIGDYNGRRPSMTLSNINMIAITSNILIKTPTEPRDPNSHRITRITINVSIISIN
jgi:hypothetical protein